MAEAGSHQPAAGQARQHRGLGTSGDPFEVSDDDSVAAPAPVPCGLGTVDDPFKVLDDESAAAPAPPSPSTQQQLPQLERIAYSDAAGAVASCQSAA